MITQTDSTEEVTIIDNQTPPQQVIKKTTKQVEPEAKGEAPQKVYDKKKTIFRFNQIIWYILGFVEMLLLFRVVLKLLGANSSVGFTSFIYTLTTPLASPFSGILGLSITGSSVIEWSTIIAAIVYLCIAWGLVYFLEMIYPITPKDVETQ
ncbi:MAG: YggT family protein [Patescibacteria group bacterium]|jgi:hypothetical protein